MINNFSIINIHEKPKLKSKLSSQMLYGEKFKIINNKSNWLKIKTDYDKYIGYIRKKNYLKKFNPTFKVCSPKSHIFVKKNNKLKKTNKFLYFASCIPKINENKNFLEFEKNKWIKKKDIKKINHKEKNFSKIFKLFLKTKYVWGGKTFKGIDCSALLQVFNYYNENYYPRDTVDQIRYSKRKSITNNFKKGDIIFWKGHVAMCLNSKELIHAYGPEKKVLIMPIFQTIKRIEETAKLKVKKISYIKY